MRILIAALLSAALLQLAPIKDNTPVNINNAVQVTKAKAEPVKAATTEPVELKAQTEPEPVQQPEQEPVVTPEPTVVETPQPTTDKESLMQAAGIAQSEWAATDYIVSHESSWNPTAYNPSGAYGLCQALPASKMASAGEDYMTNPVTQLQWCHQYAQGYGGWWKSYNFWNCIGSCYSARIASTVSKPSTWW